jgi:membrane protease YdiL (CAAX protease family)
MAEVRQGRGGKVKLEALGVLVYLVLYLVYLFFNPESDLLHWVSLVVLPLLLLFVLRRGEDRRPGPLLGSVGLSRGNLRRRLGLAAMLGIGIGLLQPLISRHAGELASAITSGRALFLLPLAFLLVLFTAGFTEEFFFRGILQTRVESLFRSKAFGVAITSILFGVYHLPYAYLNPNWPSAGDWGAAWLSAMGQGVPAGVLLGVLYVVSGRNLLACVLMHTLLNAVPAMTMIKFGGH